MRPRETQEDTVINRQNLSLKAVNLSPESYQQPTHVYPFIKDGGKKTGII